MEMLKLHQEKEHFEIMIDITLFNKMKVSNSLITAIDYIKIHSRFQYYVDVIEIISNCSKFHLLIETPYFCNKVHFKFFRNCTAFQQHDQMYGEKTTEEKIFYV